MYLPFPRGSPTVVPCPPAAAAPPARGWAHPAAFPVALFPRDARQVPALTLLAEGSLGLEEQPQQQQAAGGHGGSGAGERRQSRARRPPAGMSPGQLSNTLTRQDHALTCLFKSCCREGGASLPPGNLGHGDLNLTVPSGRAWEGTQAQNIRIDPGGKNETQMGKTLPQ